MTWVRQESMPSESVVARTESQTPKQRRTPHIVAKRAWWVCTCRLPMCHSVVCQWEHGAWMPQFCNRKKARNTPRITLCVVCVCATTCLCILEILLQSNPENRNILSRVSHHWTVPNTINKVSYSAWVCKSTVLGESTSTWGYMSFVVLHYRVCHKIYSSQKTMFQSLEDLIFKNTWCVS